MNKSWYLFNLLSHCRIHLFILDVLGYKRVLMSFLFHYYYLLIAFCLLNKTLFHSILHTSIKIIFIKIPLHFLKLCICPYCLEDKVTLTWHSNFTISKLNTSFFFAYCLDPQTYMIQSHWLLSSCVVSWPEVLFLLFCLPRVWSPHSFSLHTSTSVSTSNSSSIICKTFLPHP